MAHGFVEIVWLLLEAGTTRDLADLFGDTALIAASVTGTLAAEGCRE